MRLFFSTVDAALELLPWLEVEEDRVWLHDQLHAIDMSKGPCVIEILTQAQNNKGMHRKPTHFLVRSPASVMLHPVQVTEAERQAYEAGKDAATEQEAELSDLRAYKARREEFDAEIEAAEAREAEAAETARIEAEATEAKARADEKQRLVDTAMAGDKGDPAGDR